MNNNGSSNLGMGSDSQPYFTPGVGNASPDSNPSAENLNTDDTAWQNSVPHDLGEIGQKAIYSPESTMDEGTNKQTPDSDSATTEMSMPPGYNEPEITDSPIVPENTSPQGIQMSSNHITRATIDAVKSSEAELSQTGDAAKFYDQIRGNVVSSEEGK